jgi:NAD(P)-dependent dehydrogenase (short-subunit alcohol dehydrogenase family)
MSNADDSAKKDYLRRALENATGGSRSPRIAMLQAHKAFKNLGKPIADMGAHGSIGPSYTARTYGIRKVGMKPLRKCRLSRNRVVKPIKHQYLLLLYRKAEGRAVCKFCNAHVKLHVIGMHGEKKLWVHLLRSGSKIELVKMLRDLAELSLFLGSNVFSAEPGRLCFERLSNHVASADVLLSRYADPRANPRSALHQPLGLQALQCLRNGDKAHMQPSGQTPSGEYISDAEVATENLIPNLRICSKCERFATVFFDVAAFCGGNGLCLRSHSVAVHSSGFVQHEQRMYTLIVTFDPAFQRPYYLTYQYVPTENTENSSDVVMDLKGKSCLITGGTSGIGAATALLLAQHGAHIAIVSRSQDNALLLQAAAESAGGKFAFVRADVANIEDCTRCVNEASAVLGGLDILVHSAGGTVPGGLMDVTEEAWQKAFDVHVHAIFRLCRVAVPLMKEKGEGAIILISSSAGLRGCHGALAYGVVKGALPQFARALARELADANIRVNCVSPGVIRTPFQDYLKPEQVKNNIENRIPLHREGQPEDVARVIAELVRNEFITGENVVIDGGLTMRIA